MFKWPPNYNINSIEMGCYAVANGKRLEWYGLTEKFGWASAAFEDMSENSLWFKF